ncbi:DoxX family protein [Pseudobowmanella zhangzhouensis]|uniref:HvfX family Cu-binding RiPP maturation protein n=1 Tax=Pseudobowmanella zhangzhouensis TaxID=1537679 RepID=UPI00361165B3
MFALYQQSLQKLSHFDGIGPLLLRLYLAPVLLQGWNKAMHFGDTVSWFEHPLELPLPGLMAALATGTEIIGAILLLLGLATRLSAIPLMVTMLVAAFIVHWQNGWLAIADPSSWLASGNEAIASSAEKLNMARDILQQYGHYDWLTSSGNFVILNNGIEFAATYFLMLLMLLFSGGGRYTSVDYWIKRRLMASNKNFAEPL